MRVWNLHVLSLVVCAGAIGCGSDALPTPTGPTGTIAMDLTGTAPTGTSYRLRDATLTVDGPTPTVFHTEDDPTRTSLSADAAPGDYTATLADGWHLERLDAAGPTPVTATLESDNPLAFTVVAQARTTVPLRFHIDSGTVQLGSGYDIVLGIDEGIPSPGAGYQAIDAPTPRTRLVFDGVRQALYALDVVDQEIERYSLESGAWTAQAPVVVPGVSDITITPDQSTLILLDDTHVNDVSLADPSFTVTQRATLGDTFCGEFFSHAQAGANNKVFITTDLHDCSGFSTAQLYDTQAHTLTNSASEFDAKIGGSGDGSRIYIGTSGLSPPPAVSIFTPATNTFVTSTIIDSLDAISVADDASRVLLGNSTVYNQALTLLGNIQSGGSAVVSHNGSRAYVYRDDAPGPRVLSFDLHGTLGAGAVFPLLHTIPLPDTANTTNGNNTALLTTTADDTQLFISGDRKLLVVPVN